MTDKTTKEILKEMETKLDDSVMRFSDARILTDLTWKMQIRIDEITESRDKWKARALLAEKNLITQGMTFAKAKKEYIF